MDLLKGNLESEEEPQLPRGSLEPACVGLSVAVQQNGTAGTATPLKAICAGQQDFFGHFVFPRGPVQKHPWD